MKTKRQVRILAAMMLVAVMCIGTVNAQTKGDNIAAAGIGFGGYYSGALYSGVKRMPAISLYYEHIVKDNLFDEKSALGIGGMLGYTSAKVNNSFKTSNTVIGVRGSLHYSFVDKLDTYTGLMLGYDIVSWKWDGIDYGGSASSGLAFSWFLGARYYFTDKVAAFAELGYGVAVLNLGVALKF